MDSLGKPCGAGTKLLLFGNCVRKTRDTVMIQCCWYVYGVHIPCSTDVGCNKYNVDSAGIKTPPIGVATFAAKGLRTIKP